MTATLRSQVGVVGAGIVGLAAAYVVQQRGASVTVYERGAPGNAQSGGSTRIFRHVHADPRLVRLARVSRRLWGDWSERWGSPLISDDGVVLLGDTASERLSLLEEAGVEARLLAADEVASHLPVLAAHDGPALLDPGGGAIRVRAALDGLVGALQGAFVRDEVLSLGQTGSGIRVHAGGVTGEHDRVVICAGTGSPSLARGIGIELPLRMEPHVRLTFPVRGTSLPRLACLLDASAAFGEAGGYASPLPGNQQYAVGLSGPLAAADAPPELLVPPRNIEHVLRPILRLGLRLHQTSRDAEPQQQTRDVDDESTACRGVVNLARSAVLVDQHRTVSCPQMTQELRNLLFRKSEDLVRDELLIRPQPEQTISIQPFRYGISPAMPPLSRT
jgi:sarcosine oxidase